MGQPIVDQAPGDREARRKPERAAGVARGAPVVLVGLGGGTGDLLAGVPLDVLELLIADRRLAAAVGRAEPEHLRRREGPRLRGDVVDLTDDQARLLAHLARDGLLERFARLHEARERRVAAG